MVSLLLSMFLASVAAGAVAEGTAEAPGRYDVGVLRLDLRDAERSNRKVTSEVWYPIARSGAAPGVSARRDAACADGKFPLIVFSHGASATRWQSTYLTEHWASHGYVVVAPDHQFNTLLDTRDKERLQAALERPNDCSYVIDQLIERNRDAQDRLFGHVDEQRVGAAGHSFGAYTALVLAGATVDGHAAQKLFNEPVKQDSYTDRDPRVKAVIAYAPVGPPVLSTEGLAAVKIPVMVFAGTNDRILPLEKHQLPLFENLGGPAFLAAIEGGSHFCFNNANLTNLVRVFRKDPILEDRVDRAVADVLVKRLSLAFLDRYVADRKGWDGAIAGEAPVLSLQVRNVENVAEPAAQRPPAPTQTTGAGLNSK